MVIFDKNEVFAVISKAKQLHSSIVINISNDGVYIVPYLEWGKVKPTIAYAKGCHPIKDANYQATIKVIVGLNSKSAAIDCNNSIFNSIENSSETEFLVPKIALKIEVK